MRAISAAREARIAKMLKDPDTINRQCADDPEPRDRSVGESIPYALHPHIDRAMQRFAARHRTEFEDKSDISWSMNIRKKMGAHIHFFIQVSVFLIGWKAKLCFIPSITMGADGEDWRHLDAPLVRKGVQEISLSEIDPQEKSEEAIAQAINEKLEAAWKYLSELAR